MGFGTERRWPRDAVNASSRVATGRLRLPVAHMPGPHGVRSLEIDGPNYVATSCGSVSRSKENSPSR
jgi:hypothetical protein